MIYQLTESDWKLVEEVANARHRTEGERPDSDLMGAAGEVAFSRLFGLHDPHTRIVDDAGWDFEMPNRTRYRVDVKTITKSGDNLLVPKQGRAGVYVLCLLNYDNRTVTFVGWISGGEAKVYGRIAPWGKHYIVDRGRLHHFDTFYNPQMRIDPRDAEVTVQLDD